MANQKNKNNKKKNSHKHVYWRKKNPKKGNNREKNKEKHNTTQGNIQHQDTDKNKQSLCATDQHSLEGSIVVNLEKLQQFADDFTQYSTSCEGSITLNQENRAGTIKGDCSNCEHAITLETYKKVKGPRGYNQWECNLAAVWGQIATGTGHRQLEETMSVMGVPVLTKATFISTERDIGECWKQILLSSMAEAGQEEKKIAKENGRFHEGVPAVTVIVGPSAPINTAIMPNKEWQSSLAKKLENCCLSESETSSAMPGKREGSCLFPQSSSEMETDIVVEGFECMEFVTPNSLEMVTALFIQLSSLVFLDGAGYQET